VKALELKVKAAEEGVTVARSGWYPQIFLSGNFYYSRPNQRFIPARDEFKETWDVGVSLSWDVWNWGATLHQTEYAGAQHAQAVDALAQRRDGITLEVTQAYLALEEARQRIEVAEKGVAQGEENYRMTSQKYKAGLVLSADLIDAEAALLSTKWSLIQALADYNIAQAGLEKATGDAGRKD
jgi:outer membrane protein TolC